MFGGLAFVIAVVGFILRQQTARRVEALTDTIAALTRRLELLESGRGMAAAATGQPATAAHAPQTPAPGHAARPASPEPVSPESVSPEPAFPEPAVSAGTARMAAPAAATSPTVTPARTASGIPPSARAAPVVTPGGLFRRAGTGGTAGDTADSLDWSKIERFIAEKWLAIAGGLILALGGIFLVSYSIEQGWIGPRVRVALGLAAALAMIVAGEWLRRQPSQQSGPLEALPHAPAAATGAGLVTAFATTWAAHGLYHLLGDVAGLALLAAVAGLALFLAVLHGPYIAVLGLIGANITPLLISTDKPNVPALYTYLAIVFAVVWTMATHRGWRPVAQVACGIAVLWGLMGAHSMHETRDQTATVLYVIASLLVLALARYPWSDPRPCERPGLFVTLFATICGLLFVALVATTHAAFAPQPWAGLLVAVSLVFALALWRPAFVGLTVAATLVPLFAALGIFDLHPPLPATILPILTLTAIGLFAWGMVGLVRAPASAFWAGTATAPPLILLALLYWHLSDLAPSATWGMIGIAAAVIHGALAERLIRRPEHGASDLVTGLFLLASCGALALGLAMALRHDWLTVALAAQTAATALVWRLHARAPVLLGGGLLMGGYALVRLIIAIAAPDTALHWGYGVALPAVLLGVAAHLFAAEDAPAPVRLTIDTISVAALAVALGQLAWLIAGYATASYVTRNLAGLATMAGLWLAAALLLLAPRVAASRPLLRFPVMALAPAAILVLTGLTGALLHERSARFGPAPGIDLIGLGYALPAALMLLLARRSPALWWRAGLAAGAFAAVWLFLTFEVRRAFAADLAVPWAPMSSAETYAYSAVWLAYGAGLFILGLWRTARPVRLAGLGVLAVALLKLFLVDMSDLTGLWRAGSFLGLGAALIGLAALFRRFGARLRGAAPAADPPASPAA